MDRGIVCKKPHTWKDLLTFYLMLIRVVQGYLFPLTRLPQFLKLLLISKTK